MKNEAIIMEQIRTKALARKTGNCCHGKLISRNMVFKGTRTAREVTLLELEEGYQTVARFIRQYGDTYLPIFIRLHKEIEAKRNAEMFKSLAIKVANNNVPKDTSWKILRD